MISILIIFSACTQFSTSSEENGRSIDQVVLIIDRCPNYSSTQNDSTKVWSSKDDDLEITAINSDLSILEYKTNPIPTRDTVVFPTKGDVLEIDHIYKFHEYLSFRVQKGDTVLFTYDEDFPNATILNRDFSDQELNYERIRKDYILSDGEQIDGNSKFNVSPVSSIKGYLSIKDKMKYRDIKSSIYQSALSQAKAELELESRLLDSLSMKNLISDEMKSYFLAKSTILYEFNEFRYNKYHRENYGRSEMNMDNWSIQDQSDLELSGLMFYNRILDYIEREEFYKHVPKIEEVNRRYPDYRLVYDSVRLSGLNEKDKTLLLTKNMTLIIQHFPQEDVEMYLTKFVNDVKNKKLIDKVIIEMGFAISQETLTKLGLDTYIDSKLSLSLIDVNNEEFSFKELIDQKKGKLVYVDFWASFCVPCFVAMPYSKELINDYKDEEIAFIYLSIDKEYERWQWGLEKAKILEYESSYMVNWARDGNNFISQVDVSEIPRYLLFDQNGNLIHYKAFGPKTPEIRKVFDRYLNQ